MDWLLHDRARLEVLGFPGLNEADEKGLRELLAEFEEAQLTALVIEQAIRIRKANRIKIPDALIGATAIVHKAQLVTRNVADFKSIEGLQTVNPAARS